MLHDGIISNKMLGWKYCINKNNLFAEIEAYEVVSLEKISFPVGEYEYYFHHENRL